MSEFDGRIERVSLKCVEKRVVEPQTMYFGVAKYPGIFRQAILYWHRITTAHCINGDNKRAGMISNHLFLRYNGYKIKADEETLYVYCLMITNHKTRPKLDEVEDWLKNNSIQIDHFWTKI